METLEALENGWTGIVPWYLGSDGESCFFVDSRGLVQEVGFYKLNFQLMLPSEYFTNPITPYVNRKKTFPAI